MTKVHRIGLSILIFAFCTGFDWMTKDFAKSNLSTASPISLLNDSIRLQYTENPGAMLSMGANLPSQIRFAFFVLFVGIVLTTTFVYAIKARDLSPAQVVGLLLIVSGGAGNFIDRLCNNGAAIDFMNLGIGPLRTGIFNFADIFIIAGVSLFIILSIKKETSTVNS